MKRHQPGLLMLYLSALAVTPSVPALAQSEPAPGAPKAAAPAAASNDPSADPAIAAMVAAATAESDRWLALIDGGNYAETWVAAAVVLQEAIPQKEWVADLTARQPKVGRTIMRERKSGRYSKTLRGAPTGDYVIVSYLTKFEKTPVVEETLAVAKDAIGQWRVAGYDVALSSAPPP
jgi:hypothetical protein